MARKETVTDSKGRKYEIEVDDDDEGDDDDSDSIYLDEEDIEWLKRKRLEEAESTRHSSSGQGSGKKSGGKVVKIRAKQQTSSLQTGDNKSRRRVLRLGA